MVHLFDEPQFNPQDGYIGFMLDFFRKLRAEGRLVFFCLHPTASWHLEILAEIAEQFLLVADGGVTRQPDFRTLVAEPRFRSYLGPEMTRAAELIASPDLLLGGPPADQKLLHSLQHQFAALVEHGAAQRHHAGGAAGHQLGHFERGIDGVAGIDGF